ncbi:succinate dehydrogenase, hydrophobic membrane anchor protein [Sphingomicrobium astaxanthinifaciens]|uniref:succinate dehydrogenase, hydrophobic membrane anchor protein n=1 Tax=Sphingomicrobium astaxanthinifaciens TaxID=1227949 RepID=UPI001FCC093C|nr:succinate dehydrogenase, hydrophobic membrane anchor protein [Sphingomicrobium astaxanthinifaciens]MCJ7421508.1 succinate dehydrogenase, hydrophobic membrane anchor protein [Sphingomicrobium astaxanthinifaciens]
MGRGKSASPLAKVRGLGSAGEGGEHWLYERFTSVALVLLAGWFLASLVMLPDFSQPTLVEWLASPMGAVPMALFVITSFAHGLDGLKVVVDDYVHEEGSRIGWHFVLTILAIAGASFALFSLATIAFGA